MVQVQKEKKNHGVERQLKRSIIRRSKSQKAIVPKSYGNFMVSKKSYLKKDGDL